MRLGIQLYTLRNELDHDLDGTLSFVKECGLDIVECASLHNLSAKEFRARLDNAGLTCVSKHSDFHFEQPGYGVQQVVDDARALGAEYAVLPWIDPKLFAGDWSRVLGLFAEIGGMLSEEGLRFCYHNHDTELRNDKPLDTMREGINGALMAYEIDTYWAAFAGEDPVATLERFQEVSPLIHLKDGRLGDTCEFLPVGSGDLDWKAIFAQLQKNNPAYAFIELDSFAGEMKEAVKQSVAYLTQ